MKKVLLLSLLLVLAGWSQPTASNTDLAQKISSARKQNATLMQQFAWTCRTELLENGTVLDIKLESITYGPDGNLQRSLINDQGAALPRGFIRRAIAEHKRKETEKYLTGLRDMLDQYTLPSAPKILDFVSSAQIQGVSGTDGAAWLKLSGNGIVNSGDTLVLEVDPVSMQTRRMQITTTFQDSSVIASASFKTSKSGLTHITFAEVDVADKNMTLQVHNFDYEQNN